MFSSASPTHFPSFSPYKSKPFLTLTPQKLHNLRFLVRSRAAEQGKGSGPPVAVEDSNDKPLGSNGFPAAEVASKFQDPRLVGGSWDLSQFQTDGKTNWDGVIDAGERALSDCQCFIY